MTIALLRSMRTSYLSWIPVLLLTGCGMTTRNEAATTGTTTASTPSSGASGRAAVAMTMKTHARLGKVLRDALVRGDLATAKDRASELAHLRFEPESTDWNQHAEVMNAAAATVVQARGVAAMARSIAALAAACGDCHAAHEGPSPGTSSPGEPDAGVAAAMLRHEWAVTRLWDGLATPSDEAWAAGAEVLADPALAPELLTPGKTPVPRVGALAEAIHMHGLAAKNATSVAARRDVYAQTLASCVDCHNWLGGGPESH